MHWQQQVSRCLQLFSSHTWRLVQPAKTARSRSFLACRVYIERQQLNQRILGQLTDNAAAMEPVDCLMQKQEYITPHSRANIVHAEKHQRPPQEPVTCPALIKTEEQATDADMALTHDQLPVLLAKLEHNLARELCHISEQDYVTLTQMLKPVQVCMLLLRCKVSASVVTGRYLTVLGYVAGCLVHCFSVS